MKKAILILIILLNVLILNEHVEAKEITGQVIAVNAKQDTILLKCNDNSVKEYKVKLNADISLNNREVSLLALRPITPDTFQYAKVNLDSSEEILSIASFYSVVDIKVKKINEDSITLQNLDTDKEITYSLDSNIELLRNNFAANLSELRVGDKGIAIFGVGNKLNKLVLYHYEVSGMLADIDYQNCSITINLGTRLKPSLKTYTLSKATKIITTAGETRLDSLKDYNWIKLEVDQDIKTIVARKL